VLALGNIGLHFFANHFEIPRTGRITAEARTVSNFKAQPTWGCEYQPAKCGN
jgi:hypothetical protein